MAYDHKESCKPPSYMYYYRPFDKFAVDILENKRLYLKSALDFNDPFDCSAFSLRTGSPLYYQKQLQSDLKKSYISDSQKQKISQVLLNRHYEDKNFWYNVATGMQSKINKFGIFSFCCRPDNFLLWSHYANKHQGLCFAFDMHFMPTDLCRLLKVRYKQNRPVINFSSQEDYHLIFNVKSSIWKYEDEWRCIIPNCAREYIPFQEKCLHAVICGIGISEKDKQDIFIFCSKFKAKPIIYQAVRSEKHYKIILSEINY